MTKDELRAYRDIKFELRSLNCLLSQLEFHATDKVRSLYDAKRERLEAKLLTVEQAIETLKPTERHLMRLRYIECKSWPQIEQRLHYGEASVHRIHASALRKLKDK